MQIPSGGEFPNEGAGGAKAEKQEHAKKREGKEMLVVDASKDRIMDDFFFSHKLS